MEALPGLTFISYQTRGNYMQTSKLSKTKPTLKVTSKTTKAKSTDSESHIMAIDPFARRGSVHRSPPPRNATGGSIETIPPTSTRCEEAKISMESDASHEKASSLKLRKTREHKTNKITTTEKQDDENILLDSAESISSDDDKSVSNKNEPTTRGKINEKTTLQYIRNERSQLEEFLFNENNKVSKNAIRFILSKWMTLEGKLQEEIMETEKLRATYLNMQDTPKSYARAASMGVPQPALTAPVTEKRKINKIQPEAVLIKPIDENDKRDNDEIKTTVLKQLSEIRNKIKVIKIRQMRQKGIVIEVNGKEDVKLINSANIFKSGLEIKEPKKLSPTIMIYDVDEKHNKEDLKEDLIQKNFDNISTQEHTELLDKIKFLKCFKTKNNYVNWIVQIPGRYIEEILAKGRVYMEWQIYRVREFINVIRCYKCQGYGHTAKVCHSAEHLCELCGKQDHMKQDCPQKETPTCVNCARSRRRDFQHPVRSKMCPEYIRHVEIYRSKVKWA